MLGYKDPEEMTKNELGFWVKEQINFLNSRCFENKRMKPQYFLSAEQFAYIVLRYWWREYIDKNKDAREIVDLEAYESICHVRECYGYYDRCEWTKEELREQLNQEQVMLAEKCISDCAMSDREWNIWKKYLMMLICSVRIYNKAEENKDLGENPLEVIEEMFMDYQTPNDWWSLLVDVQAALYPEVRNRLSDLLWAYVDENNLANQLCKVFEPYGLLGEDV